MMGEGGAGKAHAEAAYVFAQARMARLHNYYAWILRAFAPHVGRRVWDASAGAGWLTERLVHVTDFVLATEYTPEHVETLTSWFGGRPDVVVEPCDLRYPDLDRLASHDLDTVINLDVLEHLENDVAVLKAFREVLRPGGKLLLKVPAHPWAFGTIDEASLHHRRYSRRMLRERLRAAGFEILRIRPMNMAALVPYVLQGRILRRRGTFSSVLKAHRLDLYNRLIPWLERIERIVPPPVGLSLITVARKPFSSGGPATSGHRRVR